MFNFHYNYMKKKYEDKCKWLGTDTDSLMYYIETEDVYEDMYKDKEKFDFSDYPKYDIDHETGQIAIDPKTGQKIKNKFYDDTNIKVPGIMKEDLQFNIVIEFIGISSKCYSIEYYI